MRIGIFDSGLGGLTVLKTLIKKYPNNEYFYYGDTLNNPYGNKTKEELNILATNCIDFLLKFKIDIIVVACGTISSNCIPYLKKKYNIPIYDIISPTINYLNKISHKSIGIIATNATINSHFFGNNLNGVVYEIATPELVPLIENNELTNIENILLSYLANYLNKIDILVLGCTHYPLLMSHIKKVVNTNIKILDMSDYIELKNGKKASTSLFFSKLDTLTKNNIKRILTDINYTIKQVK